jgi:hypothetical protein
MKKAHRTFVLMRPLKITKSVKTKSFYSAISLCNFVSWSLCGKIEIATKAQKHKESQRKNLTQVNLN